MRNTNGNLQLEAPSFAATDQPRNGLVITGKSGKDVTTSLIISKVFGKEHRKVCRDIESLNCSPEFNAANFGRIVYMDSRNRKQVAYEITRDGFSFLAMGFTGAKAAKFKEDFINEFNNRGRMLGSDDYIIHKALNILTKRVKELDDEVNHSDEVIKLLKDDIKHATPKVEYFDAVMDSKSLIPITVIAGELGTTAVKMNEFLRRMGVIMRVGESWVMRQCYQNRGWSGTKTYHYDSSSGETKTVINLYWTEVGRQAIHDMYWRHHKRP